MSDNNPFLSDENPFLSDTNPFLEEEKNGMLSNMARNVGNSALEIGGDFLSAAGKAIEAGEEKLTELTGINPAITWDTSKPNMGLSATLKADPEITKAGENIDLLGEQIKGVDTGYKPEFTWERLKEDITLGNFAGYVAEQGAGSIPHMLAAVYNLPSYVVSRSETLASERAVQDGREEPTADDYQATIPAAIASAMLERFGAKGVGEIGLGMGSFKEVGEAALKAAGKEGGTEFVQEQLEYAGTNIDTESGWDLLESLDRGLAGLVAGAGMGAAVRGTTATGERLYGKHEADPEKVDEYIEQNELNRQVEAQEQTLGDMEQVNTDIAAEQVEPSELEQLASQMNDLPTAEQIEQEEASQSQPWEGLEDPFGDDLDEYYAAQEEPQGEALTLENVPEAPVQESLSEQLEPTIDKELVSEAFQANEQATEKVVEQAESGELSANETNVKAKQVIDNSEVPDLAKKEKQDSSKETVDKVVDKPVEERQAANREKLKKKPEKVTLEKQGILFESEQDADDVYHATFKEIADKSKTEPEAVVMRGTLFRAMQDAKLKDGNVAQELTSGSGDVDIAQKILGRITTKANELGKKFVVKASPVQEEKPVNLDAHGNKVLEDDSYHYAKTKTGKWKTARSARLAQDRNNLAGHVQRLGNTGYVIKKPNYLTGDHQIRDYADFDKGMQANVYRTALVPENQKNVEWIKHVLGKSAGKKVKFDDGKFGYIVGHDVLAKVHQEHADFNVTHIDKEQLDSYENLGLIVESQSLKKEIKNVDAEIAETKQAKNREKLKAKPKAQKSVKKAEKLAQKSVKNPEKLAQKSVKTASSYGQKNKVFTADAADKARELLKKKLHGTANSGLDPEIVQAGITLAGYHIEAGARKFNDYSKAMVGDLGEAVKPYLRSWYEAVRHYPDFDNSGMDTAADIDAIIDKSTQEKANVSTDSGNLEQDSQGSSAKTSKRQTNSVDAKSGNEQVSGKTEPTTDKSDQSKGSESVSNYDGAVSGKGSANGLLHQDGSISVNETANDTGKSGRSSSNNDDGSTTEQRGTSATDNVVEQLSLDKPLPKAKPSTDSWGDLNAIQQAVPALLPEQAQDIVHIENRFFTDNGAGYLNTNGTGTGKTFVGLGTIRRFVDTGKKNILVIVPSDGIANEWVSTDKAYFGIGLYKLGGEDGTGKTKDKGQGVTVATYATFGQNKHLILDRDNWDLVIADESQNLMAGQQAKETNALGRLRILTNHERAHYAGARLHYSDEQQALDKKVKAKAVWLFESSKSTDEPLTENNANELARKAFEKEQRAIDAKVSAKSEELSKLGPLDTKVLFLSATPFPYVKTLDSAEGYLFDYTEYGPKHEGGYDNGSHGHNNFYIQNFGYRWRYHKLNTPSGEVDSGIMERQFYENMKEQGRLGGRTLEVDQDYNREFFITPSAAGQKLDELKDHWRNYKVPKLGENGEVEKDYKGDDAQEKPFDKLASVLDKEFDYVKQIKLIEAIKAPETAERIKQYVAEGKQAVIFHSFNVGGSINPIALVAAREPELFAQYAEQFPDKLDIDFGELQRPLDVFAEAFGDQVGFYNGNIPNAERKRLKESFQDDDSNLRVLVVQIDAGEAGISLHDLTGKHERILTNIGVPAKPTQLIQTEGRTYRTGVQTNAQFEYPITGTAFEDMLWAHRIAGRASTAENLAMGDLARSLKESIVDGYTGADIVSGLSASFGIGGKVKDRPTEISDWDRAKSFYWSNAKRTQKTKSAEGNDYFATPEPLGKKMVEWMQVKAGDRLLEPSVGHAAIGRWFPATNINRAVEASSILAPRAQLNFDGKVFNQDFEDFSVLNKFEGIAMNPPFGKGKGGKLAYDHITKAVRHLTNGGRILAIVPDGNMANKRLDKFLEDKAHKNIYLSAVVDIPAGAFARAGTGVKTKILVLDRFDNKADAPDGTHTITLRGADEKEFFDNLEHIELPPRGEVSEIEIDATEFMDTEAKPFVSKKKGTIYPVKLYTELPAEAQSIFDEIAKEYEGYTAKDNKSKFMFFDDEAKADFIERAAKTIVELQESDLKLTFEKPISKQGIKGENANEYFELQDDVHVVRKGANLGKEQYKVNALNRLDYDTEFLPMKALAGELDGYYNRSSKMFHFNSVEDARKFIKAGGAKLSGEPLISDEQAEAARKDFKDNLGRANSGLDPKLLKSAMVLTAYHIERGAKTFAKYTKAMIDYLGNIPKRFLMTWFNKHNKDNKLTTARKVVAKTVKPVSKVFNSKHGLNARMTNQIVEAWRHLFKSEQGSLLDHFSSGVSAMQAYRNKILTRAEKEIEEKWDLLDSKTSEKLSHVMLDSTMERVDPSEGFDEQPRIKELNKRIDERVAKKEQIERDVEAIGLGMTEDQARAIRNLGSSIRYYRKQLKDQRTTYNKLKADYLALGKDGQTQYLAVRDFYVDLWNMQKEALQERINDLEIDDRQKKLALDRIDTMFMQGLNKGVYFPLARFGEHIVYAKPVEGGRVVARYQFANEKEASAAARKLQADLGSDYIVREDLLTSNTGKKTDVTTYAKELIADIKKYTDESDQALIDADMQDSLEGVPTTDVSELLGLIPDTAVMDMIYQTMLRALPDNSAGKHLIHRSYIKGASTDQRRAFAHSSFHTAIKIARIKYDHKITKAISDMDKLVSDDHYPQAHKKQARTIVEHVGKIHESNINPNSSKWSSFAVTSAFMWHLAATPAAGMVNMSQTFLIGIPQLGSRFGMMRTMNEIGRLSAMFGKQAWDTKKGFSLKKVIQADAWVSLKDSPKLSDNYRKLLSELHDEGVIELTQMQAMAQLAETDMREKAVISRNKIKFVRGMGSIFHNAEIFNREVVALAAMRMYAQDYAKKHNGKQPGKAALKEVAKRSVEKIHFNYSSENRALWMRGNARKMMFVFKTYSQNVINLMLSDFARMIDGATPKERRTHAKALFTMLGAHMAAGGVLALPLVGSVAWVMNMVLQMIGDDEERDVIAEMRSAVHEVNPVMEDVLFRGVFNTFFGIDVSNRIKLDGLIWRSPTREMKDKDLAWHYIEETLGAVFGTILKITLGTMTIADGIKNDDGHKTMKGVTKVAPKFIADPAKAMYRTMEGERNYRGDELMPQADFINAGVWRTVLQAAGFSPSRLTDIYDRNNAVSNRESKLADKRKSLMDRFYHAEENNISTDGIWNEIDAFSEKYPEHEITFKQLMRGLKSLDRRRDSTVNGLYMPESKEESMSKYNF